jgi:DNA anti-recombination protein RmuC
MTDSPVRPNLIRAQQMQTTDHPRVRTGSEFREFIQQKRTESARRREDLLTEVTRLEVEIDARHMEIAEEDFIQASCDAALTIEMVTK